MKKRMKIREEQLGLIRSLFEEESELSKNHTPEEIKADYNRLIEFINSAIKQMDRFYNIITFNTLQDIFSNKEFARKIKDIADQIDVFETKVKKIYSIIYNKVEEMPEEAVYDWGDNIRNNADTVKHRFTDKKWALERLINIINNMIMSYDDDEIGKWFGNIESDIEM